MKNKRIILSILILVTICISFYNNNYTKVFSSNEFSQSYSISSFCKVKDTYYGTVPSERKLCKIINNETILFGEIGEENGQFSIPALITSFDSGYAVFDEDAGNIQLFDYEDKFLSKVERFDDVTRIKNLSCIFGYESNIYGINYQNNSLYNYTINDNYFTKIHTFTYDFELNTKINIYDNNLCITLSDKIIEFNLETKEIKTLEISSLYAFYDCKNQLHYLTSTTLDNITTLNYTLTENSLFDIDEENGIISIITNNTLVEINNLIDNILDFETPINLIDFKMISLNQIKYCSNQKVYASPYSKIPTNNFTGYCVELSTFENYSYIFYVYKNNYQTSYLKTENLINTNFETNSEDLEKTNFEIITLNNFTDKTILPFNDINFKNETLKKGLTFNSLYKITFDNRVYHITNQNEIFYFIEDENVVKNNAYIEKLVQENAQIKNGSTIIIQNTNEEIVLTEDLNVEIIKTDSNYHYFKYESDNQIIYAKTSIDNIVKKDYSILNLIILLSSIMLVLSIILIIMLKPKKQKY